MNEEFKPRPGGLVETIKRDVHTAEELAKDAELTLEDAPAVITSEQGYKAVRVKPEAADIGSARAVLLASTATYAQLLPEDKTRRSAVVIAVDNDVYITTDRGLAADIAGSNTSTQGFYLPAGIAVPIDNQSQHWVACTTTATSSRVSVLVSRDA